MILLGVSKRAVAKAMGRTFDGDSYTKKCLKSQRYYVYHLSINLYICPLYRYKYGLYCYTQGILSLLCI